MLNSKLFAGLGGLLILASPVFPQHAPGFLMAGGMSGAATWIVAEKERDVSKRNTLLTEKERSLKLDENKVSCLIEKYERSLAGIETKQKDLTALQAELDKQRVRCAFIEALRPQLEQREREVQAFKLDLERVATEQKDRQKVLAGWSDELETLEGAARTEREKLIAWTKDLEHQARDLERKSQEVQDSRTSFSEMLKAYQSQVWGELKPQAQAYAESIIAERQKPLDEWREELKATEQALDAVIPGLKSELEKEVERIKTQWEDWAKNYQEDCNEKIRVALDDRNSAHDTWKNHYMALAGKTHEENHQLRKVITSPGRHWWELKADIIIEFLNANEVAVDYYQALPTPDEKGFYLELQPKWGAEALADVLTGVTKLREALKGLVADCKQKPAIECVNKRLKLTFVMTSPSYVGDLAKESGQAANSQRKDDFLSFLDQVSQVAILGATGGGKTVLLANTIGAFSKQLGEKTSLVMVNPKPSRGSRDLGIAKYNSLEQSIFGLLEAAVEISYRIKLNELAEIDNPEDPAYPDHEPIIYLFDEYSEIAAKWNSVTKKKMDSVVVEFTERLDVARQEIQATLMEDMSPKKFASALLNTVWRLGRSEKVRVIVAGQNLMAQTMGLLRMDLWNPAFIIIGDLIWWGITSRAHAFQKTDLEEEFRNRMDAAEQDESQKYFGLFCAPRAKATFLNLPSPNQYKFSQSKTVQNQLEDLYKRSPEADSFDPRAENVQESDSPESLASGDVRSVQSKSPENAKADNPPICPMGEDGVQSGHLSKKDLERLTVISQLKTEGKTKLKEIIHLVWSDVDGVENYGSRQWRKAREEYKRLTGK